MLKSLFLSSALLLGGSMLACNRAAASVAAIPDPAVDEALRSAGQKQTMVLAGGCFWGVEASNTSKASRMLNLVTPEEKVLRVTKRSAVAELVTLNPSKLRMTHQR